MLIFGPLLGRQVGRSGPKPIMALGFALSAVGGIALVFVNRALIDLAILPILLLVGNVGVLIAMSNTIVLTAERRDLGIQTGMNQTFRNLGSSIAPVLVTTILASYEATYLSGTPFAFQGYALRGFEVVFAITAVLAVLGLAFSLALRNFRFSADGVRHTGAPTAPAPGAPPAPPTDRPAPTATPSR
jgi:MFS family permease